MIDCEEKFMTNANNISVLSATVNNNSGVFLLQNSIINIALILNIILIISL